MTKSEFLTAIADALEIDAALVSMDLRSGDLPEWDSLGHLTILSNLDSSLDGRVADIENFGALLSLREMWMALERAGLVSSQ